MSADDLRAGLAHCSEARFMYLTRRLAKSGLLKATPQYGSTVWTINAHQAAGSHPATAADEKWNIPNATARMHLWK